VMDRVIAWFEDLERQGKAKGGHPLIEGGKTISSQGGKTTVTDGPFAESKEAVGGYLLLQVDDMEEAVEIASASPLLQFGVVAEVANWPRNARSWSESGRKWPRKQLERGPSRLRFPAPRRRPSGGGGASGLERHGGFTLAWAGGFRYHRL